MANTIDLIKLKRGANSNVQSASLERGEPAVSLDTKDLWVGDGVGNIKITDVYFYNTLTNLPATGEDNKLYITKDSGLTYIWDSGLPGYRSYELGTTSTIIEVRVRMSTNTAFPSSFQNVVYTTKDQETDPTKLYHDPTNQDRIVVLEEGWYRVAYGVVYDVPIVGAGTESTIDTTVTSRLMKNNSVIMAASYNENVLKMLSNHRGYTDTLVNEIIDYFVPGDFITLQIQGQNDPAFCRWSDLEMYAIGAVKGDVGNPGPPGSIWFNGAGVPNPVIGDNNDYYLDNSSSDIYHKVSGSWTLVGNIKGDQGVAGSAIPLPAVQMRRTTTYGIANSTWGTVTFDATDVESDSSIIEHDTVNTERALIKETGTYLIGFFGDVTDEAMLQIIKNGSTVVPGSQRDFGNHADSVPLEGLLGGMFMANLDANDYLEVQLQSASTGETLQTNPVFMIMKMQASKGDQGDQGLQGPAGEAFKIDEYDHLDEAKITAIEGGSASPTDLYYFLTLNDVRSNQTLPANLNGDMTGHVLMYDGSNWYDFGPFTGLEGPQGPQGDAGEGLSEQHEVSSDTFQQTTTNTFQQKLRLVANGLSGGKYRIGWYYEWQYNVAQRDFRSRVQVNDNITLMEQRQEPKDTGSDQFYPVGGFKYELLSAGDYNIDFDFCCTNLGDTAGIRRVRLELWKVT